MYISAQDIRLKYKTNNNIYPTLYKLCNENKLQRLETKNGRGGIGFIYLESDIAKYFELRNKPEIYKNWKYIEFKPLAKLPPFRFENKIKLKENVLNYLGIAI